MVPMNRSYGMWPPPPPPQFQNPNPVAMKPPPPAFNKSLGPRSNNWKGKKLNKAIDKRRKDLPKPLMAGSSIGGNAGGVNLVGGRNSNTSFHSYQPPALNELQHQNRLRARKFFPKKFNKNNGVNMNMNMNMGGNNNSKYYNSRSAPYAPRNTTSFIIRAKKSGGIASLVSPSPMTPAVLPTPIFSPSKEVLVDMAKEEWGVDGYGSMKGLIRLRSLGHEMEPHEDEDEDEGGSSGSDVEEHVEVERRLDHDLSRFEMIYNPNNVGGMDYPNVLENRVDDQDTHIAHLEEENLILKERLFLMERELGDLRRRMQFLERKENRGEEVNEEVVENDSENESGSHGEEAHSVEDNNEVFSEDNGYSKGKSDDGHNAEGFQEAASTEKIVVLDVVKEVAINDDGLVEADKNGDGTCVEGKEENDKDKFMNANKNEDNNEVVEEIKENNNHENKHEDVEVKAEDGVDIGSSDPVMIAGDICMEEVGVAKDNTV
ncbi:hypothetical protein BUALT_Bualt02G0192100 [Buddleja alternifolia]|uniref:PRLI-interacting factor A n=1 Tax=Buddleja alternifolia TaxID=168488 RepID=A0AAV6Y1H5_9LAMI|nr:hypothetical protein BUALT_Bualt02G0192100 [Buddleja alternifolia]